MVKKLTPQDAQRIAIERNVQCLSEEYVSNATPMIWKCEQGHTWGARFANVKNSNTWCPYCNKESRKAEYIIDRLTNNSILLGDMR